MIWNSIMPCFNNSSYLKNSYFQSQDDKTLKVNWRINLEIYSDLGTAIPRFIPSC